MKKTLRSRIDHLLEVDNVFIIDGQECALISWEIKDEDAIFCIAGGIDKTRRNKEVPLDELDAFCKMLEGQQVGKSSTSPKTLNDVRNILLTNIDKLNRGSIGIGTASEMANHAQVIVNITKLELQYKKELNKSTISKNEFLSLEE